MENLIKQVLLFIGIYLLNRKFKYFFVIVNLTPLLLYYLFDLSVNHLISFFILEVIVFCFINIICIKTIDLPVQIIKLILSIISILLIVVSTLFIPEWNTQGVEDKQAFWNYASILFSFYTINFLSLKNDTDLETNAFKSNVVIKFSILAAISFLCYFISKYIQTEVVIIITVSLVKTFLDLYVRRRRNSPVL